MGRGYCWFALPMKIMSLNEQRLQEDEGTAIEPWRRRYHGNGESNTAPGESCIALRTVTAKDRKILFQALQTSYW